MKIPFESLVGGVYAKYSYDTTIFYYIHVIGVAGKAAQQNEDKWVICSGNTHYFNKKMYVTCQIVELIDDIEFKLSV